MMHLKRLQMKSNVTAWNFHFGYLLYLFLVLITFFIVEFGLRVINPLSESLVPVYFLIPLVAAIFSFLTFPLIRKYFYSEIHEDRLVVHNLFLNHKTLLLNEILRVRKIELGSQDLFFFLGRSNQRYIAIFDRDKFDPRIVKGRG